MILNLSSIIAGLASLVGCGYLVRLLTGRFAH
jgi:hypothetical protein